MKKQFYIRLMPEFSGREINDDSKCYQIVKIEESTIGGISEIKETIEHSNLNKSEVNRLIYRLDRDATLAV